MHISVAMCTYNGSNYLGEQLASVMSQSRLPDEVVVCDDKSTDGTRKLLEDFARNSPFVVRVFNNENRLGSTKNFEKAIALCSGDVIVLSDQDDIWMSNRLQRTEDLFLSDPSIGMIFGDAEIINQDSSPTGKRLWRTVKFRFQQRRQFSAGRAADALLNHNVVTGATAAFRSRLVDVLLPIPSLWVHDGWIALICSFVSKVIALDERLIWYRKHSGQQIGPLDYSLRQEIALANRITRKDYARQLAQYEVARERLACVIAPSRWESVLQALNDKILHLSARACMPHTRIQRLPSIAKELATMRYMLYSAGLRSAVRDLIV